MPGEISSGEAPGRPLSGEQIRELMIELSTERVVAPDGQVTTYGPIIYREPLAKRLDGMSDEEVLSTRSLDDENLAEDR